MTALPDHLRTKLRTTGLTARAVAEQLGIGVRQAARLMIDAGAVRGAGSSYRIPSRERNLKAWGSLANPGASAGNLMHAERRKT